ncbi:MAG: DUF4159 domain-containing protein [Gemmatimonadota bacterium]
MRRTVLLLTAFALTLVSIAATAQFRNYRGLAPGQLPEERTGFTFCRLQYTEVRRESLGQGWETDFPMADQNLMVRLSELTKTEVTWNRRSGPAHAIVRPTDPELFLCPFLFASDVGTVGFTAEEARYLREYLLKGGLLWVDDFWGPRAWSHWVDQVRQILPDQPIVQLEMDHPLFSTFYFVERVPQIPSIQFWRGNGGQTSERGYQSAEPTVSGIFDEHGRLLVIMSHNTDIADGWEREGEDFAFFHAFSPHGYAVGVNVAIWSMTH